jgi:hypothetical protein
VIWVSLGNFSTADVEAVLRAQYADVIAFAADPTPHCYVGRRA